MALKDTESRIIVDYDLGQDLVPEIIIRNLRDSSDSRLRPEIGAPIDFSLTETRYCIGYHVRDEYHEYLPCPDGNKVTKGFQCGPCVGRDLLIPCLACKGDQCPLVRKPGALCNVTPTSVYLVSFGNEVKVGVSIRERIMKRWVEQGADWGIEVGYGPNGSIARLVEDKISRSVGITKSGRLSQKLESIGRPSPEPAELMKLASQSLDLVKAEYPDFQGGDPGPVNLQPRYCLKVGLTPFRLDVSGAARVKGEFLGMKGPVFLFQSEIPYAVDFRVLRGRLMGKTLESDSEQLKLASFT